MGSDQLSCLALDSFYFSIENSVYGDYIPTTVSDWNILPGEMVQLILDIDTSIYFGSDYTFNWVINNQVISNVQDTIFNFENIQNNDILNCSIVANNSCMNIIVVPHTIFADEPMICEMIPLDSISCGEDSILMGMEILNSGLVIHDFNCTREMLLKTFSYVNCVLQHERLNRGVWRMLEVRERELAKQGKVIVEIRMVYSPRSQKLPTGATIPDGFFKTIKVANTTEVYYFPNITPTLSSYTQYKIK
jgi:hypothetical protein